MKVLIENVASVNEKDLQEKPDYITDERWERILRMRPLEDKKRSLLAGRLSHQMCEECGIKNPVYGTVGNGKPVFINRQDPAFSISHSGEYVVIVYEKNVTAVGVDIQQVKSMSDGLKRRLLHEEELKWLEKKRLSGAEDTGDEWSKEVQDDLLYLNRIWAVKESYVKMTGEGLSHDFRKLYVNMEKKTVTDENGRSAAFIEPEAPEGYVLAVIVEG